MLLAGRFLLIYSETCENIKIHYRGAADQGDSCPPAGELSALHVHHRDSETSLLLSGSLS